MRWIWWHRHSWGKWADVGEGDLVRVGCGAADGPIGKVVFQERECSSCGLRQATSRRFSL